MTYWSKMNQRSKGLAVRKEDDDPEIRVIKEEIPKWVSQYNSLEPEVINLRNQVKGYYNMYGMFPMVESIVKADNQINNRPRYSMDEIKPILSSYDSELVKGFARMLLSNVRKLREIKHELYQELNELEQRERFERMMEEENKKKQEELKQEKEKATKERKFLDNLEVSGILTVFASVLTIVVYLFVTAVTKNDPTWVLGVLVIFLGIGVLILEIRKEGFTKMKQHIKRYK